MSKGFVPHEYENVSNRYKIEDSRPQTFVAFVSDFKNYSEPEGWILNRKANVSTEDKMEWNYADLAEMAKVTEF